MSRRFSVTRFNRFQENANSAFDTLILNAYLEMKRFVIGAKKLVKTSDGWVDAAKCDKSESIVGYYPPKYRSRRRWEKKDAETAFRRKLDAGSKLGPPPEVPLVDTLLDVYRPGLTPQDERRFGPYLDSLVEMKKNPQPAQASPEEPPAPTSPFSDVDQPGHDDRSACAGRA